MCSKNKNVKTENWFWRDGLMSLRHRLWGVQLPIADIDFLVVEYNFGKAVALIEYKHEGAEIDFINPNSGMNPKSYNALNDLADRSTIPFFVVQYKGDFTLWNVIPFNSLAKQKMLKGQEAMCEREYVLFLYRLRGFNSIPLEIEVKLN